MQVTHARSFRLKLVEYSKNTTCWLESCPKVGDEMLFAYLQPVAEDVCHPSKVPHGS